MHSYPLHGTYFSQYQASCGALEIGTAILWQFWLENIWSHRSEKSIHAEWEKQQNQQNISLVLHFGHSIDVDVVIYCTYMLTTYVSCNGLDYVSTMHYTEKISSELNYRTVGIMWILFHYHWTLKKNECTNNIRTFVWIPKRLKVMLCLHMTYF